MNVEVGSGIQWNVCGQHLTKRLNKSRLRHFAKPLTGQSFCKMARHYTKHKLTREFAPLRHFAKFMLFFFTLPVCKYRSK